VEWLNNDLTGSFVIAALCFGAAWFAPWNMTLVRSALTARGKDIPADFDEMIDKLRWYGKRLRHIGWSALAIGVLRLAVHYM